MCTAVLRIEPDLPVLLAGVRDELTDRAWEPPAWHWPDNPDLVGGRDLQAGGTWLAVAPGRRRAACVLNGIGREAPQESRRSRGELPLRAAAAGSAGQASLGSYDPFHLLVAEPGQAILRSWDGSDLTEHKLPAGLHFVVNGGLASELAATGETTTEWEPGWNGPPPPDGRQHELARTRHFLRRFAAAARPDTRPGMPVSDAWGSWFPLVNGDGIGPDDDHALIVRRDIGGGRAWGTTSISLVALSPDWVRDDFTARPGDPRAWNQVL